MQATLERLRARHEEMDDEGGFTLIELLIVIVILGILAAIVVFAVQNLTSQSAKASCGSDYKTVETAMETYKAQVGHYPMLGQAADATTTPPTPAIKGDNWSAAPNGTATNGTTPSTFTDGVEAMFNTQPGVDGNIVGSWLKDVPSNGNLYRVGVSTSKDGSTDVIVVKNLSTNAISPAGATLTVDTTTNVATVTVPTGAVNGTCSGAGL